MRRAPPAHFRSCHSLFLELRRRGPASTIDTQRRVNPGASLSPTAFAGGFRAASAALFFFPAGYDEGRVGAIGLAVRDAEVVAAAMRECELDCTLLAGRYSLFEQGALSPLLDKCVRHGNAIVIGDPFHSGRLSGNGKLTFAGAPAEVRVRAKAIAALCGEFEVPLPAAALQFPMAHPAVVSCVPGAHGAAQLRRHAAWFDMPIPPQLWQALKQGGLLHERAPALPA